MPMIKFECCNPECDNEITKIFVKVGKIPPFLDCGQCGVGKLERTLEAPSQKSIQTIDNGTQVRKTEVMQSVVEKERDRMYRDD